MKTSLSLSLALLALASAQAQVLRPATVNGALLGGIAGAVIGHNSGSLNHNGWKGAAIGAGAGALVGSAVGRDREAHGVRVARPHGGTYIYRDRPSVHVDVGYRGRGRGYGYGSGYGYSGGSSYYGGLGGGYYGYDTAYPGYGYGSGSYATNGLWLGALTGGIIGHNSGEFRHNGWRGAAWGAGVGWLLGSIADANRRQVVYEQPAVMVQAQPAVPAQPAAAPQQVTIINNYYGNTAAPMSAANSMFGR